jgi:hypothetical protein
MKKNKFILSTTLLITLLYSCKKEEPKTPTPTPVNPTGDIRGRVNHFDQFGEAYTSGLQNATVSIEGSNKSGFTDASGNYTLSRVSAGTYTLLFSKTGCGSVKKDNVYYSPTDTLKYDADLADIATFQLSTAYVKDTTWFSGNLTGIYYHASSSVANNNASVVAIIGKTNMLDIENPGTYLNYANASLLDSTDFNRFFSYSLLKDTYTFQKDSVLYLKIYPVSTKGSSYFDANNGTIVYTAFGMPYPTTFTILVK